MGPLKKAIESQLSPPLTLVNLLQLVTMPGCVGIGVATVFPGCVGVPLMSPMQTYVSGLRVRHQRPPTPVFQSTKSSVTMGPLKKGYGMDIGNLLA
jgi:hypothetical protein